MIFLHGTNAANQSRQTSSWCEIPLQGAGEQQRYLEELCALVLADGSLIPANRLVWKCSPGSWSERGGHASYVMRVRVSPSAVQSQGRKAP